MYCEEKSWHYIKDTNATRTGENMTVISIRGALSREIHLKGVTDGRNSGIASNQLRRINPSDVVESWKHLDKKWFDTLLYQVSLKKWPHKSSWSENVKIGNE